MTAGFPKYRRRKGQYPSNNTRHSRESGNPLRRFRKEDRADIADGRFQIPAFAGMTIICKASGFFTWSRTGGSHRDGWTSEVSAL